MKIKTLAVIGLLALAPVHSTELNAASNTTVKVAKDDSGKVDYKNFYKNGKRVKYEDWNKGKKVKETSYKNGKVNSKTYYKNGVKTRLDKWSNGKVVQKITYKAGKVNSKTYYTNGVRTEYEKWNKGRVVQRNTYENKKISSKKVYENGNLDYGYFYYSNGQVREKIWHGNVSGALNSVIFNKSGVKTESRIWKKLGEVTYTTFYSNGQAKTETTLYLASDQKIEIKYSKNGSQTSYKNSYYNGSTF